MSMKRMTHVLLVAFATGHTLGQTLTNLPTLPPRPPWSAVVTVVDESNKPVADAKVEIGYDVKPPPGQTSASEEISGLTDTNGVFSTSHEDTWSWGLGFRVTKQGYYPTTLGHQFYLPGQFDEQTVVASRHPQLTLVLKNIGKPIPMYVKSVDYFMPTNSQPVGFDFAGGDWVAPYGHGKSTDIIFITHFEKRANDDYDYNFTVSFPNQGDGIQGFEFPHQTGGVSALRSPHEAPENGYLPKLVKSDNMRPGQFRKYIWDEKTNYLFRVRTVLDEHGNIKSALYGKMYGDFNHFRYYLNPVPNDRNIEFDPKRNLFGGQTTDAP